MDEDGLTILRNVAIEMNHCKVFVRTREKMHPEGVRQFDALLDDITSYLKRAESNQRGEQ